MSTQKSHNIVPDGSLHVQEVDDAKKKTAKADGTPDGQPAAPGTPPAATTTEPTEEKWEKLELVADPIPFKSFGKTTRIRLDKLGMLLHALLKQKFHDIVGVFIEPYATTSGRTDFITTLYFEDNKAPVPAGKYKNLINQTVAPQSDDHNMLDYTRIRSNRSSGKTYTLSMETRQLLAPFMYGKFRSNAPKSSKWESETLVQEIHMSPQYYQHAIYRMQNAERIVLKVKNFDIKEFLRLLYGGNTMITETVMDDNGDVLNYHSNRTFYDIRLAKYDSNGVPIVNIEQFDKDEVDRIMADENPPIRYMNGNVFYYSAPEASNR